MTSKPVLKPNCPNFSSGPAAKRPGWSASCLSGALLGRSHRSGPGKIRLQECIDKHRTLLAIPADYKIGIVPASDTGAIEMAMWSMLGARGVDVLSWESFGKEWLKDIKSQLKISDMRSFDVDYGDLPDFSKVDCDRDVVFTWNGTTSGACVPDSNWIKDDRQGLTFCDATSAVFAYDMPWSKLDVTTWSWQKVIGGEAAHGMLVLSPRAVARLESFTPDRPLPKIFRMTAKGKLIEGIFTGETINTPSMLALEDCMDSLRWVDQIGGLKGTIKRCQDNLAILEKWVEKSNWITFLVTEKEKRSVTSVCFKMTDPWFESLDREAQVGFVKDMCKKLDKEGAGYDLAHYRDAPAGLRVWCGATVEASDVAALTPWLDWAFADTKSSAQKQAA